MNKKQIEKQDHKRQEITNANNVMISRNVRTFYHQKMAKMAKRNSSYPCPSQDASLFGKYGSGMQDVQQELGEETAQQPNV